MAERRRLVAAPPGEVDPIWGPFRPFYTAPVSEPLREGERDITDELAAAARGARAGRRASAARSVEGGSSSDSSAGSADRYGTGAGAGREGGLPRSASPAAGAGAAAGEVTTPPRAARGLPPLPPSGRFCPLFEAPPGTAGTGLPITTRILPVPARRGGSGKARAVAVHAGTFWSPASALPVISFNKELTNEMEELQRHYSHKLGAAEDVHRAKNMESLIHWVRLCPFSVADQWDKAEAWFLAKDSKATGFGEGWQSKLHAWSMYGVLEDLAARRSNALLMAADEFSDLWAVGHVKALKLARMGFTSIADLRARLTKEAEAVLGPTGVRALPLSDDLRQRIPRREVEAIRDVVATAFDRAYGPGRVHVALTGSYRRNARTQGDVDLVVTPVVPVIRAVQRGSETEPDTFGRPGYVLLAPVMDELRSSGFVTMGLTADTAGGGGYGDTNKALAAQRMEEEALEAVAAHSGVGPAKEQVEAWRRRCYERTVARVWEDVEAEGCGAAKRRHVEGGGGGGEEAPPPLPVPILPWPPVAYDSARWMGIVRLPDVDAGGGEGEGAAGAAPPSHLHRRLDILSYTAEMASFIHLYFTGPKYLNRSMRAYVDDAGWTLGDHGLKPALREATVDKTGKHALHATKVWEGNSIECVDEASIFAACGLPYMPPELRRAENEDVSVGEALEAIAASGARYNCPDGLAGLQRLVRAGSLTREQAEVVADEAARVGRGEEPRIVPLEG